MAVFGDVHGALDALYWSVARYEAKYGVEVVAVLQAGDMGVWPDPSHIDWATGKRSAEDPTELGVAPYVSGGKRATHPTWFVRGNHEDFEFLMEKRNRCIDPYGMIHFIFAGPATISRGGERLVVAGLGGIESAAGDRLPHDATRWKYIAREEVDALSALGEGGVDVLLTHDGPLAHSAVDRPRAGSKAILELVERLQPRYHFFGHYGGMRGEPAPPHRIGRTLSVCLNQPGVYKLPAREGGMGILDTSLWSFRFVGRGELEPPPTTATKHV